MALKSGADEVWGWFSEDPLCKGVVGLLVEWGDKMLCGEKSKRAPCNPGCCAGCSCSGLPLDQIKAPLGNRPNEHSLAVPELGGVVVLESLKAKALG